MENLKHTNYNNKNIETKYLKKYSKNSPLVLENDFIGLKDGELKD